MADHDVRQKYATAMNTHHLWSNKKARRFTIAAALFIAPAIGFCAFLRISRPADLDAYLGMASECHPVWRQFALRRFNAGDSTAGLFAHFPPSRKEEFGRYGIYWYYQNSDGIPFTGLAVVTRDGRLLSAESGSCTWRFAFFRTADPDLDIQYAAYCKEISERHEQKTFEEKK